MQHVCEVLTECKPVYWAIDDPVPLHVKWNFFKIISAFVYVQTEIILPKKLFQNNFRGLLQLMNIFQLVQYRWNNSEIVSAAEVILK